MPDVIIEIDGCERYVTVRSLGRNPRSRTFDRSEYPNAIRRALIEANTAADAEVVRLGGTSRKFLKGDIQGADAPAEARMGRLIAAQDREEAAKSV